MHLCTSALHLLDHHYTSSQDLFQILAKLVITGVKVDIFTVPT
jgi:hypothetical protein